MRRPLLSSSLVLACCLAFSPLSRAQAPDASSPGAVSDAAVAPDARPAHAPEGEPAPDGEEPTGENPYEEPAQPETPRVLEPPNLGPLTVEPKTGELPNPAEAADRLEQAAPPAAKRGWTLSETVFHLHGYMRFRGTYLKDGALGHRPAYDRLLLSDGSRTNYDPFPYFAPDDSTNWGTGDASKPPVAGGCGDSHGGDGRCSKRGQVSGDMRFRVKPEIHLSDDVRVKAWIDVLDNVGLGTMGYGPGYRPTDLTVDNAIRARRVWGEARNRDIGELRFGRMGADWGLGILDNGGDRYGIDSDFSSEVDRLMGITNLAGFYLMAAYDWASEGKVLGRLDSPSGVPIDRAQRDDLDAFTFSAAHKLDDEVQQSALARGESVFNYGVYFVYRKQLLRASAGKNEGDEDRYVRLKLRQFVPDLWFQVLWEGLRIELEAAFVAGKLEGSCPRLEVATGATIPEQDAREDKDAPGATTSMRSTSGSCKFRQLGVALEMEYRLFDERLGLYFLSGFASGDSDAYGLAATNDPSLQRAPSGTVGDRTISTYQFHPDYRIDLILWRTVMRRVAGAYYFKPGLSYDFIRDPYGQLAGGRIDAVYSRAATPNQTWGHDGNLGLELDVSLYYRSEDGPDLLDGFYGLVQWGVLFPFDGLGYDFDDAPKTRNAMILRGVAGIAF